MSKKPIFIVDSYSDSQRLDNFLLKKCKQASKSELYKLIRKGQVRINGKRCQPLTKLSVGDAVRVPPFLFFDQQPKTMVIDPKVINQLQQCIIAENQDYLVINKPPGMAVHVGTGHNYGVIDVLKSIEKYHDIQLAHRLDAATSGCLVLARNKPALLHFQSQLKKRTVVKTYVAILQGVLAADITVQQNLISERVSGIKTAKISDLGKPAETRFEVVEINSGYTQVRCYPITGRTHQIRAHAAYLGCPIIGDIQYGAKPELKLSRELFLHALSVQFNGGDFSAPLPKPFETFMGNL